LELLFSSLWHAEFFALCGKVKWLRSKAPGGPKLDLWPVIDAIREADTTAPPKQRYTAKRIFERLRIETRQLFYELWLILGDSVNQAADLASGTTSIPSRNLTASMTFGN
jgi:hypothetical protein